MEQTSGRVDLRRVGIAAAASVATSAAWYAAWGPRLAELDEAYADGPPPAWVVPVELGRSAAVASAVAVLAARGDAGTLGAVRLGAGLWLAFPVVLLTGSVAHEKVPWQQAAIHAGDWLVKLLVVAGIVGGGRRA